MKLRMQPRRTGRANSLVLAALLGVAVAGASLTASGASTQRVVKFRTPGTPTQVIAAYGSIWVAGGRGANVYRIDPRRNRNAARISTSQGACGLWAQGRRLYVEQCDGNGIQSVVDPRKNKVVGIAHSAPYLYARSLWKQRGGGLQRLDPKTHAVLKTFKKIDSEVPLGFGYGSVWIGAQTTVTRIDAATNTRTLIPLPGAKTEPDPRQGFANPWRMAFVGRKAWYGNPAGIYDVDLRTNKATLHRIPIGPYPDGGNIDLVAGSRSLWAGTSETRVVRIDPTSGRVSARYPGGGGDIAVAYGSLWVTKPVSDQLWRIAIR